MKRHRKTSIRVFIFCLLSVQLSYLIYRTIHYKNHYPTLIGVYCFNKNISLNYIEDENQNDELNIQECSFKNIDICQHIFNQTLLFQLHWTAGFTSELNNLIRGFIYAIHTRRRFFIDDQYWNYGSFASYFNTSQGRFSPWLPLSSYCLQRKFIPFIHYKSDNKYIPDHLIITRDIDGGFSSLNLMMKSIEDNNQILQMKRIVAEYLWKTLNNQTRNFIDHYVKKIQLNNLTYAIHIRRGDKLRIEAKHISFEKYLHGIEYFINKYSKNDTKPRIYIASDDYNITDQFQYLRPDWEFVHFSQTQLQSDGHKQDIFNSLPIDIKIEKTRILLTDLEILSRVKYVVCTFSSNICRFVQILRKQEPDTVLSLDETWYPQ